jgi:hypothetical protein
MNEHGRRQGGNRENTFERTRVVESPFTAHLGFRVVKP